MIKINGNTVIGNQEGGLSGIKLFFLMMLLMGQLAGSPAQSPNIVALTNKNLLIRVFEYRDCLEGVHPFVIGLYNIALATDNYFYVFDLDETRKQCRVVTHEEIEMKIPKGVRAAFPLQFYDDKSAGVATGEVFYTLDGYVTIFHEFIHCHQWHVVEPALREQLPLAQKADERGDYKWETNHPFPYADTWFEKTYTQFIRAAENLDHEQVKALRHEMAEILNNDDYQYLVWQELKHGYALFVENKLRSNLGLPTNPIGRQTPYNRTVFYAGGEAFISLLIENEPEPQTDMTALFGKMI